MNAWIDYAIVPLLLLLTGSTADWSGSERYMIWTKNDTKKQYHLQLCASKGEEKMCGNFTWRDQSCKSMPKSLSCFSKFNCSTKPSSGGNFM